MNFINPVWIIQKKRDGQELSESEIRFFIEGIAQNKIPDYQASALLMAIYFQGMSLQETVALTRAMLESGVQYNLSAISGHKVDKHSTGGVGDKVSLILAPLAAACGIKVPMMSGRGLGHSGGTLDKLESIDGFNVHLSEKQFATVLSKVGCAMIGQSEKIAPADRKLYALRDVTSTVECIPLIVASILSKKLAEGAESLVLDVKVGNGAFMKTRDQARKLAKALIRVAEKMNLSCRAVLTDMSQPLGSTVGNAIEVAESIAILRNERNHANPELGACGSEDLKAVTIELCAHMLDLGKKVRNLAQGRKLAQEKLADGSAWKVFQNLVQAQGGLLDQILHPELLPSAPQKVSWGAAKKGYITQMNTETIGKILIELGGGRKKTSDPVDPGVGLAFHKKLGNQVQKGEPIVTVRASKTMTQDQLEELRLRFENSIEIKTRKKPVQKLVLEHF